MAKTQVEASAQVKGVLPVVDGGTGVATLPLNQVLVGNGTGSVLSVAPGSSGNVLQSNGVSWVSAVGAVANYFSVDGGNASTNFAGTLRIDFGGAS